MSPCLESLCSPEKPVPAFVDKCLEFVEAFGKWNSLESNIKGAFFWAYSGIGIAGISQAIVRSQATLIPQ